MSYNPEGWAGDCLTSYGSFNFGTVLTEVLYKCGGLQCSNPRDNVYGILGVVEDIFHLHDTCPLVVGYEIEVEGLYFTMTKTLVETVPNLAILSLVRDPSQRSILSLPSWVPDLHHITKLPFDIRLGLSRKRSQIIPYNVAYHSANVPIHRYVQGNVLHLRGSYIGDLIDCGGVVDDRNPQLITRQFLPMLDICNALPNVLRNGEDRIEALWRTIVIDKGKDWERPAAAELSECFHDWILHFLAHIRVRSPEALAIACEKVARLSEGTSMNLKLPAVAEGQLWRYRLQTMSSLELRRYIPRTSIDRFDESVSRLRALFRTSMDDLGLGPPSSRPGDQVWALENTRMPFVLRPTPEASSFEVVGECYVHGIMDGQLLAGNSLDFQPICLV